eukprot:1409682-Rhodomonas_salina.2
MRSRGLRGSRARHLAAHEHIITRAFHLSAAHLMSGPAQHTHQVSRGCVDSPQPMSEPRSMSADVRDPKQHR